MLKDEKQCPICKLCDCNVKTHPTSGDFEKYECPRCSQFTISRRAKLCLKNSDSLPKISAWLRERNLLKVQIPMIREEFIDEIQNTLPRFGPLQKQNKLLQAIEAKTSYPGSEVVLVPEHDWPLAWAENEKEFAFYVDALVNRGMLAFPAKSGRTIHDPLYPMHITPSGWEHLERLETEPNSSIQAFVAMSFDSELLSVYENAIAPAIELTGYTSYRVDTTPHLDRIDVKIVAEIRRSRFMVADVTQQKAGVYYEAGYAHGLGIPVVWCVKREDLENVHFDTRQYNHIVWDTEEGLQEQLTNYIRATIGERVT